MEGNEGGNARPVVTVRIGGLTLTGAAAGAVLLVVAAGIVALVVAFAPRLRGSPLWISAALWLAFIVYWNAAARTASAAKRSESPGSRQLHATLLNLGLLLLFLRLPGLTLRWLPPALAPIAAGLALHVGSGLLAVWARRHLGRHWSGAVTAKVDHELVRTGPYRALRHPIYTGMLGMSLGTALVSGELHALVGVGLLAIAYARKIPLEERTLREVFGSAYDAYRESSWALIPGLY